MAREKIFIKKGSYNSTKYKSLIDTEFKTFVNKEPIVETDTITELFRLYDKLFYTIPKEGEDNSHEYFVKKSSELISLDKTSEDIKPFLDEIAQLRRQLLEANETIFQLENNG